MEHGEEDHICWKLEPKGNFSVKTAYLLAMDYFSANPNTSGEDKKLWSKLIWSRTLPPKVKKNLWRVCRDLIPTEVNLRAHHVPVEGTCNFCSSRWDFTDHALFWCPLVRDCWKESRFWRIMRSAEGLEFIDMAEVVRREFQTEEFDLWCIMVWSIWTFCCKFKHGEREQSERPTEMGCLAILEAFKAAQPTFAIDRFVGVKIGQRKWCRPRRGRFWVDVDALFDNKAKVYGAGIIIRDSEGQVVAAATKRLRVVSSPMMAELMAVVQGVIFSMENDVMPIEIFTDSFLAARVLANEDEEEQFLPNDICDIIKVARENCLIGVNHVYREANMAAHRLAQFARSCPSSVSWTGIFPDWLRECVVLDDS